MEVEAKVDLDPDWVEEPYLSKPAAIPTVVSC